MIPKCDQLKHLDLSWCERNSADFLDFYEMLSENRQLTHLSLAWNSLFDQKTETSEEGEVSLSEEAQEALDNLTTFVRKNHSLKHLDLSNTGM